MRINQRVLLNTFGVYFLIILWGNYLGIYAAGTGCFAGITNPQQSCLPVQKENDIVIYRKDIIVHSDEQKIKSESGNEEYKSAGLLKTEKQQTSDLDNVNKYLKENKKIEARNILSDLFMNKKMPEKQKEIKELLDKLNEELIFSPLPTSDATLYTVQPGDVLAKVAKKFATNYELIMRINGKPTARLNIGEKLKILTGKTKILVNKSDFTLTLLLNDCYVRQYRICIGKDNKTPVGVFEVKNKMKEPTWYSPEGGVFPYGHKENILGTRWIGLKDKPNLYGYGIHGTTKPETIGTASSNGCVRMVNNDVEELYDFVTLDTEIVIQE